MEHEVRHKLLGRNKAINKYPGFIPSAIVHAQFAWHRRRHLVRGMSRF